MNYVPVVDELKKGKFIYLQFIYNRNYLEQLILKEICIPKYILYKIQKKDPLNANSSIETG